MPSTLGIDYEPKVQDKADTLRSVVVMSARQGDVYCRLWPCLPIQDQPGAVGAVGVPWGVWGTFRRETGSPAPDCPAGARVAVGGGGGRAADAVSAALVVHDRLARPHTEV